MQVYDYSFKNSFDEMVKLSSFKGDVLLLVNTASKCGFTPQYEGLQKLHEAYEDKGLKVIGFPCNQFLEQEPGTAEEIQTFCKLNYGVTFELSEKMDVRGENADPLFKYLSETAPFEGFDENTKAGAHLQGFLKEKLPHLLEGNAVKWNFTKFLVDRNGNIVKRFEPTIEPESMIQDIEALL